MSALRLECCAWRLSLCPQGQSVVFRAWNSLGKSSLHLSLETFVPFSAYFVSCRASRSGPRRHNAEPRQAPDDPSCAVLWNEELQFGHEGNGAFSDAVPNRSGRGRCQEYSSLCCRLRHWLRGGQGSLDGVLQVESPGYPGGKPFCTRSCGCPGYSEPASGAAVGDVGISRFRVKDVVDMDLDVDREVQPHRPGSWAVEVYARGRPRCNIGAGAEDVKSGAALRVRGISSMEAPQGVVLFALRT